MRAHGSRGLDPDDVGGLTLDPATKTPIVILRDAENKLNLPIWIGLLEATAIATELEGIKMARPMTHDLLRNLHRRARRDASRAIEITDLRDNTYYAVIHLRVGDTRRTIDSRPSDAISLALRIEEPDLRRPQGARGVERAAAEARGRADHRADLSNVSRDKWSEILEKMSPDDFKYKM